jgi:putative Mn2+ efflux pump MntP
MSRPRPSFIAQHSLSLAVAIIVVSLLVLYRVSDPQKHLGSFFGNAIADWTGLLLIVIATKYLYESGSPESRKPPHPLVRRIPQPIRNHSLTIFLLITGLGWALLFGRMDVNGKWGQVVGNIVSEWTQIIGTVLLTKKLREVHSKESKR